MKTLLSLCVLFVVCGERLTNTVADDGPWYRTIEVKRLMREADEAKQKSDWPNAGAAYSAALDILQKIRAANPEWDKLTIEQRIQTCTDNLESLKPHLPQPPPLPAVVTPPPPVVAPPPVAPSPRVEAERTKQLSTQLKRSQEEIRKLEAERDDLNARLQQALKKVSPTETNPKLEELLKKTTALTAQLAERETDLTKLRDQLAASAKEVDQSQREITSLRDELKAAQVASAASAKVLEGTKKELEQSRKEITSLRGELKGVQTDNAALRRTNEETIAKLANANRKLSTAQSVADKDEKIIGELRKEIASLRREPEHKSFFGRRTNPKEMPPTNVEESNSTKLAASIPGPQPRLSAPADPVTPVATAPEPAAPPPVETEATAPVPQAAPNTSEPVIQIETVAWLKEGSAALADSKYDEAAAKFNAVLQKEPDNLLALSNLGVALYRQQKFDEAELVLKKAIEVAPTDAGAYALLGMVHVRKGMIDPAFNELTRAVAIDPRNADAHNFLGITMSAKGQDASAEKEIRTALKLDPNNADAHFNLAVLCARGKKPHIAEARVHYQKALALGAQPDTQLEAFLAKSK